MHTVDSARQTAFHADLTYNAHHMQVIVQHAMFQLHLWVMILPVTIPAIATVSPVGTSQCNDTLSMGQMLLVQHDQCSMTIAQLRLQLSG